MFTYGLGVTVFGEICESFMPMANIIDGQTLAHGILGGLAGTWPSGTLLDVNANPTQSTALALRRGRSRADTASWL